MAALEGAGLADALVRARRLLWRVGKHPTPVCRRAWSNSSVGVGHGGTAGVAAWRPWPSAVEAAKDQNTRDRCRDGGPKAYEVPDQVLRGCRRPRRLGPSCP